MAYEMRISDWSSDVCSSDLDDGTLADPGSLETVRLGNLAIETDEIPRLSVMKDLEFLGVNLRVGIDPRGHARHAFVGPGPIGCVAQRRIAHDDFLRSEEHTSELQSLMRISYAVFCLKKK